LTGGSLAELCLRAEWGLLARVRRAECVAELRLLAESVLRVLRLLAGVLLPEGTRAELSARAERGRA
jgi:hypothetical protein